jgi:hypothetical protein
MENQFYHISKELKLIRVSQFLPLNNGDHVIAILKRIFHNSNTSRSIGVMIGGSGRLGFEDWNCGKTADQNMILYLTGLYDH